MQEFPAGGVAYEAAAKLAKSDEQKLRYWHEAFNNYQNVAPEVFAAKELKRYQVITRKV